MATVIHFEHDVSYPDTPVGPAPALLIALENPRNIGRFHEVIAYLDTGAKRSLFDGEIATSLGIDMLRGEKATFSFTNGASIGAREHDIWLSHPSTGRLLMTLCFSEEPIRRMLLGRHFFELFQVGFRHYDQMFFVSRPH